jgi:hypothetical protein
LRVDHLVELRIAVAVVIPLGTAGEILVQRLIEVIEPVPGQVEGDL